ncbi:hypothetical protein [uncultured Muribaculum sp.]|uniref:hypothetical protein n=1 Tax=uncultured Muribaculum sp. TaxID=1918613 RepID=UPI0027311260|nr:hypothetical protein [uncultured Muribaculum sp.]
MELLNSNNSRPNTQLQISGGLVPTTADSRAIAIRQQYGNMAQLCKTFSVDAQRYCALNVEKAIRNGVPTFVSIVNTYSEDGVAALIGGHITDAIVRMGEERDIDPYDVDFISRAICESERFRLLSMASILRFFHLLKCGEFDIYGKVTPRKILEAFRKYAVEQQAKENRIAYEIEQERMHREQEEARKNAVSWEQFCENKGIDLKKYPTMMAYFHRKAAEEKAKAELPRLIAELIQTFVSVITFIDGYLKDEAQKKK